MRTIQISDEDSKFLEDLQHELNTQTNDGNADPVYWGVMETREVGVPDGCGDERIYLGDGGTETLEGAIDYIASYLVDDETLEAWNEVDKTNTNDVIEFCREKLGMLEVRLVDVEKRSEISRQTGAFLTKRACKEYIDCYGYNHNQPHTYAMTAYRNFELERLLKILKTMEFKDNQPVAEPVKEFKKLEMPNFDEIQQISLQNIRACCRGNMLPSADFAEKTIEWYIKWYNKKNKED